MARTSIQRNNARIVGQGKRTVVFSHGFGSDQTAWRHQEADLAEDRRLVLFDHVGAGRSDLAAYSPRRYQTLRSYAADLLELLAELDLEEVDYVGHSMGGMIGLLAALDEPERFRKMVFISASPRYLNDDGYRGGFEQKDIDALYEAMTGNYHAWASGFAGVAMGNPDRPELAQEFASTLCAIRPDIALAVSRLIFQSDHRADLPSLRVPTLILQTNNDVAVPREVGEYLAGHIPGAELEVIDAQGHLPHLSAPAAVTAAIRAFLA
jgi:sigma-B regulation protein RsbQ